MRTRNQLRSATPSNDNVCNQSRPASSSVSINSVSHQDDSKESLSSNDIPVKAQSPDKGFNLLICVTGSVAAIKLIELVTMIRDKFDTKGHIQIRVILTEHSQHFVKKEHLSEKFVDIEIYRDVDEWDGWKKMSDPVLHIELRKWADLCLIAPLDANTMAKMANGICDNLLTCMVRAWDLSKPLVYCPAMNVHMYTHPLTAEHFDKLQSFGYHRIDSVEKRLACGDVGIGGMASVETISNKVLDLLVEPIKQQSTTRATPTNSGEPQVNSLLNHHATNFIVPLTRDHFVNSNSPSLESQILDRFISNDQISIHPVPNLKPSQSASSSSDLLANVNELALKMRSKLSSDHSNNFLLKHKKTAPANNNSSFSRNNIFNKSNNRNLLAGNNSVNSLNRVAGLNINQKIKVKEETQSGSLTSSLAVLQANELEYMNRSSCDDLDPSGCVEQTMITEDSISLSNDQDLVPSITNGNSNPQRHQSSSGSNIRHIPSPMFNTTRFLAICYNKERDHYTCAICKNDYKNRKSMARHLREQHVQGNIYNCVACGTSYKRREKLSKHLRDRHPDLNDII